MRFHPRRNLRRDEEGVASTVGTVMALLVALTFLGVIVNQYVPVWQKESEAAHMNQALGQFGSFKSAVDSQVVSARVASTSDIAYIPVETYTSVQLGVEGVPIFSSPSTGRLTGAAEGAPFTVQFRYAIAGTVYQVNQTVSGNVVLSVASRYNVPFDLAYESGAIIMSQAVGEAVRVQPQFSVINASAGAEVGLTLVQLIGSGNVAGHGSEGIRSKVVALDMQEYGNFRSSLWINHTTRYGHAWFGYFNETLALAFGVLSSDFQTDANYTYFESPSGQTVQTPYYVLTRSQTDGTHVVSLRIIHEGGSDDTDGATGRPLSSFAFHTAFVSIAVGRGGSTLEV